MNDASCNNIDDDCNGFVDDGYITTSTSCGVGACSATGQKTCTLGVESDSCTAGLPSTEICGNGIDDKFS